MEPAPETETPAPLHLLVGTFTGQGSRGIYRFEFDFRHGTLGRKQLVAETSNPSYLSISKDRKFVYVVNEDEDGRVVAFQWNADGSQLSPVSEQSSEGAIPCHTELNEDESLLAVSNYRSGSFGIFKISEPGLIADRPVFLAHMGHGPVRPHQASARGHCVRFAPNGRFLYAVDLGIDQIVTYPVNSDGSVGAACSRLTLDPGDGPRQLIFHPTRALAFVVNQLSGSVTSMRVDHESGLFERVDKQSTLPADYVGQNASADIHISSNGKFLYASNRIHDSIAIFAVSEAGALNRIGIESVRGSWPRGFTFSPDERFLLVANQKSDNITLFSVDPDTGLLTYTGNEAQVPNPVILRF